MEQQQSTASGTTLPSGCAMILLVLDLERIQACRQDQRSSHGKSHHDGASRKRKQLRAILANVNRLLRVFRDRSDCQVVQVLSISSAPQEGGLPTECLASLGRRGSSKDHRHSILGSSGSSTAATTTASVVGGATCTDTILRNPPSVGGFPTQKLRSWLRHHSPSEGVVFVIGHLNSTDPQTLARILAHNDRVIFASDASSSLTHELVSSLPRATLQDTASIVHGLRCSAPASPGALNKRLRGTGRSVAQQASHHLPPRTPIYDHKKTKKTSFRPPSIYRPQHEPSTTSPQQESPKRVVGLPKEEQCSPTSVLQPPIVLDDCRGTEQDSHDGTATATVTCYPPPDETVMLDESEEASPVLELLSPRRLEDAFQESVRKLPSSPGQPESDEPIASVAEDDHLAIERRTLEASQEVEGPVVFEQKLPGQCDESVLTGKEAFVAIDSVDKTRREGHVSDVRFDDADTLEILDVAYNDAVDQAQPVAVSQIEPETWELCHWVQSVQHWTRVFSNSNSISTPSRCDTSNGLILRSALFAAMQEMVRANPALQALLSTTMEGGSSVVLLDTEQRSAAVRHPSTSMLAIGLPALLCGA